jgi:hypothetical protein
MPDTFSGTPSAAPSADTARPPTRNDACERGEIGRPRSREIEQGLDSVRVALPHRAHDIQLPRQDIASAEVA